MEVLYRQLESPDFVMLAISVDEGSDTALREFLAEIDHSYPILLDARAGAQRLQTRTGQAYGITGVPETFVIDRNGYILDKVVGPAKWSDPKMYEYFRGLLEGPS